MRWALLFMALLSNSCASSNDERAKEILGAIEKSEKERFPAGEKPTKDDPLHRLQFLEAQLTQEPEADFTIVQQYFTEHRDMSSFETAIASALAAKYIDEKNRERLIELLSANLPEHIATNPTELCLANSGLEAPFDLLVEVYKKACDPVKQKLVTMFTTAFPDQVTKYKLPDDSAKFIEGCAAYVKANRAHLELNGDYGVNPFDEGLFSYKK